MPIDASIYSQLGRTTPLEGPLDQFGRAMQVKNLMGQSQLQGLQIGQAQRGIEEQQRLRDLFSGGATPTTQQVMAVSPTSGIQYGKSLAEQQSAKANLLKQDSDLIKSFGEQAKNELITVTDQPSWDKYRALQRQRASLLSTPQFQQVALEALQKDPEVFDPAFLQAKLSAGTAAPAGHTRMPGGGLSPVDPNYIAAQQAVTAPQRALTASAQAETGRHNRAMETAASGTATREALAKINTQENLMRDDFTNASKEFVKVRDAHQRVMSSAQDPSAAGDLALIFNYMKVLDPGSTVREGEFANAQNSGGVDQRTIALYNSIARGERLSDKVRADFLDRSGRLYNAAVQNQETIEQDYTAKAERAKARPEQVVSKFRVKQDGKGGAPGAPVSGKIKFLGFDK